MLVSFSGFEISQFVIFWVAQNWGSFLGVEEKHYFLANWKFALFFGLLRKETTELLPRNRFPFTLLPIFLTKLIKFILIRNLDRDAHVFFWV